MTSVAFPWQRAPTKLRVTDLRVVGSRTEEEKKDEERTGSQKQQDVGANVNVGI